jgi:hypothetical protein
MIDLTRKAKPAANQTDLSPCVPADRWTLHPHISSLHGWKHTEHIMHDTINSISTQQLEEVEIEHPNSPTAIRVLLAHQHGGHRLQNLSNLPQIEADPLYPVSPGTLAFKEHEGWKVRSCTNTNESSGTNVNASDPKNSTNSQPVKDSFSSENSDKHDDDPDKPRKPTRKPRSSVWKCSDCGKVYSSSGHLARHKRSHTSVLPYSCPIEGSSPI